MFSLHSPVFPDIYLQLRTNQGQSKQLSYWTGKLPASKLKNILVYRKRKLSAHGIYAHIFSCIQLHAAYPHYIYIIILYITLRHWVGECSVADQFRNKTEREGLRQTLTAACTMRLDFLVFGLHDPSMVSKYRCRITMYSNELSRSELCSLIPECYIVV